MAAKGAQFIQAYTKPMRPAPPPRPPEDPCPDCPPPSQDGNIQGTIQSVLNMKGPDGRVGPLVTQNGGVPVDVMTNSAWPIYIQVVGNLNLNPNFSGDVGVGGNLTVSGNAAVSGSLAVTGQLSGGLVTANSFVGGNFQCGSGGQTYIAGDGSGGTTSTLTLSALTSITVKNGLITAVA